MGVFDQRLYALAAPAPDDEAPRELSFEQKGQKLEVRTPGFLVYGVVVVQGKR